jgi:hypothetical protein
MEKQLEELNILKHTAKTTDCPGILNWVKGKLPMYRETTNNGPLFNAVMDIRNEISKKLYAPTKH